MDAGDEPGSDEQGLCALAEIHEVGRADDALYGWVKVGLDHLHHVEGHPAGPHLHACGFEQVQELGHGRHTQVRDLLVHHVRRDLRPVSYTHLRAHETVLD